MVNRIKGITFRKRGASPSSGKIDATFSTDHTGGITQDVFYLSGFATANHYSNVGLCSGANQFTVGYAFKLMSAAAGAENHVIASNFNTNVGWIVGYNSSGLRVGSTKGAGTFIDLTCSNRKWEDEDFGKIHIGVMVADSTSEELMVYFNSASFSASRSSYTGYAFPDPSNLFRIGRSGGSPAYLSKLLGMTYVTAAVTMSEIDQWMNNVKSKYTVPQFSIIGGPLNGSDYPSSTTFNVKQAQFLKDPWPSQTLDSAVSLTGSLIVEREDLPTFGQPFHYFALSGLTDTNGNYYSATDFVATGTQTSRMSIIFRLNAMPETPGAAEDKEICSCWDSTLQNGWAVYLTRPGAGWYIGARWRSGGTLAALTSRQFTSDDINKIHVAEIHFGEGDSGPGNTRFGLFFNSSSTSAISSDIARAYVEPTSNAVFKIGSGSADTTDLPISILGFAYTESLTAGSGSDFDFFVSQFKRRNLMEWPSVTTIYRWDQSYNQKQIQDPWADVNSSQNLLLSGSASPQIIILSGGIETNFALT